jgi:hypothetical protein
MTAIRRLLKRPTRLAIVAGIVAIGTSTYGVTAISQPTAATTTAAVAPNGITVASVVALNGSGTGAPTNALAIHVQASRDSLAPTGPRAGADVTTFKWLIQEDTTGDPQQSVLLGDPASLPDYLTFAAGATVTTVVNGQTVNVDPCHPVSTDIPNGNLDFPNGCTWPSIHSMNAAPVVSEGDQTNWSTALTLPADDGAGHGLQAGTAAHPKRYLVSVTADGYQLGGAHFTVPMKADTAAADAPATVHVALNPYPIPLGTMRIRVFNDNASTNGQWDQESEGGLAGFEAKLSDYNGLVSVDYYGNPLCTTYKTDAAGNTIVNKNGVPTVLKVGGHCLSDANGDIVIPNLPPNRYGTSVVAPEGQTWIQTTTLEGNHDWDVWVQPNESGYDTELVVGGEAVPFVDFGFVHPQTLAASTAVQTVAITGHPTGGTFTLSYAGQTTAAIARNATAATVAARLRALSSIGFGNVTVTGGPGPNTPWTVTLADSINFVHAALITGNGAALTGGASPAITIIGRTFAGRITGTVTKSSVYFPGYAGLQGTAGVTAGTGGIKLTGGIEDAYIVLTDLNNADASVYAGQAAADGTFDLRGVPDGDYSITVWDVRQEWILDTFNVSVRNGQTVALGNIPLAGWFTDISGTVFVDKNGNGKRDPGEEGVKKFTMQNLDRTNNTMESGQQTADTDNSGFYHFAELYPLGQFSVLQFFNTRYKTTGLTWQTCNDKQEHTVLTAVVDLSYNAIIGQCGRVDVGVQAYDYHAGDQGGIVATAAYDSIRQKFNARQAQTLLQQTGIPGIDFRLYQPGPKAADGTYPTDANGALTQVVPNADNGGDPTNPDGTGVQSYISENYGRPKGCYPMDVNGQPFTNQDAQWGTPAAAAGKECVESPMTGLAFGLGDDGNHGPQTVDGNYGLAAPVGDYIVQAVVPKDQVLNNGKDLYKVTTENDVNTATGENFIPQNAALPANYTFPPAPASGKTSGTQVPGDYQENPHTTAIGPDPQCAGPTFQVHVTNPDFLAVGGSPLEGQTRHLCDSKLFHINAGQSIAPNFHFFTDVPIATFFTGLIVDDVNVTTDKKSTGLGEVRGINNAPTGVYDWTGALIDEVNSDYNGIWEALEPSSDIANCLTPSGVCPNVYRFVGNDPGQPSKPNVNYQPGYRTISANFQAWPGNFVPADTAPTMAAASIQAPGAQFSNLAVCKTASTQPQLLAVDNPYVVRTTASAANTTLTIDGQGFGATAGAVALYNEATSTTVPALNWIVVSWSDTHIVVHTTSARLLPAVGNYELRISKAGNLQTTNALTYHIVDSSTNVILVGHGAPSAGAPNGRAANGQPFTYDPTVSYATVTPTNGASPRALGLGAIQQAIEKATNVQLTGPNSGRKPSLIVVYPAPTAAFTPLGTYYENLIVHSAVQIQGVGPGGLRTDGSAVQGTVLDGRYFWTATTTNGSGSAAAQNEAYALAWDALVTAIGPWDGFAPVTGGADVYVVARNTSATSTIGTFRSTFKAGIDGFTLQGGDQRDFPGNITELGGAKTGPSTGVVETQGGAVFVNAYANFFSIANNLIQSNSGSYGAIRIGTAFVNVPGQIASVRNQTNDHVSIAHNQIYANGGTNLAGALGLFSGSTNYRVTDNVFCGNSSTEYGGAIGHYGRSGSVNGTNGGRIDHNKIFLNSSIDEGGGVLIAGELPLPSAPGAPTNVSEGSGAVTLDHNDIAANLGNDDGGGVRLLMVGDFKITIENNMITNNVSTHEGGGISLDDAPWVLIDNNTIAKNITTATATTSDGSPAPAGISTGRISAPLLAQLHQVHPTQVINPISTPTVVNDVFYDNRAGSWTANGVAGIGQPGDATGINYWDLGSIDQNNTMSPTHSVLNSSAGHPTFGYVASATNRVFLPIPNQDAVNPFHLGGVYDINISIATWRSYFRFRPSAIVAVDLPALPLGALGNYRHQSTTAPAYNLGAASFTDIYKSTTVTAPSDDIDGLSRPFCGAFDAGASELHPGTC